MTSAAQAKLLKVLAEHQGENAEASERDRYLDSVEDLYVRMRGWLDDASKQGLAQIRDGGGTAITESGLGAYYAPKLFLDVGRARIRFVPRGVGGEPGYRGRIDVDAADRIALLVLDDRGVWHFKRRQPAAEYEVNEASFADMMAELLER